MPIVPAALLLVTAGFGLLLTYLSDPALALWGLVIAQIGGILRSMLNRRSDREEIHQKHVNEMEVLRSSQEESRRYRAQSLAKIEENTQLTRGVKEGIATVVANVVPPTQEQGK